MLDSSPLPIPPPKKLKRTASVASLPSPPPSVDHLKKRTTAQRFTNRGSGSELESDDEEEEANQDEKFLGRKLLFPPRPSASIDKDDQNNPFLDTYGKPSNARDQLAIDAISSPSVSRAVPPASPPPSRRKTSKPRGVPPKTPPPVAQRGSCAASELPVLDEENNPFLSDSPPRLRRPRSPRQMAEPETITYLFKGVKTSFPNPNYNLPESVYENSHLPLDHPDYSPPPTRVPRRLFPEAYPSVDDAGDDDEQETSHGNRKELQTPDTKPRMSKLFVDGAGNPLPDSGPQGVRGNTMDANEIGRMAVGPIRGRG